MQLAETAMKLCEEIRRAHDVYLLQTMISGRNFLHYKLMSARTPGEAKEVMNLWQGQSLMIYMLPDAPNLLLLNGYLYTYLCTTLTPVSLSVVSAVHFAPYLTGLSSMMLI